MVGSDGHKSGKPEPVCVDTGTDEPAFATVASAWRPGTGQFPAPVSIVD